jgi:hypothetical protein
MAIAAAAATYARRHVPCWRGISISAAAVIVAVAWSRTSSADIGRGNAIAHCLGAKCNNHRLEVSWQRSKRRCNLLQGRARKVVVHKILRGRHCRFCIPRSRHKNCGRGSHAVERTCAALVVARRFCRYHCCSQSYFLSCCRCRRCCCTAPLNRLEVAEARLRSAAVFTEGARRCAVAHGRNHIFACGKGSASVKHPTQAAGTRIKHGRDVEVLYGGGRRHEAKQLGSAAQRGAERLVDEYESEGAAGAGAPQLCEAERGRKSVRRRMLWRSEAHVDEVDRMRSRHVAMRECGKHHAVEASAKEHSDLAVDVGPGPAIVGGRPLGDGTDSYSRGEAVVELKRGERQLLARRNAAGKRRGQQRRRDTRVRRQWRPLRKAAVQAINGAAGAKAADKVDATRRQLLKARRRAAAR